MSKYNWFRRIALAEGISFLVLLLIAMPLKYLAGFPIAVTIVGALHGILFITFVIVAWEAKIQYLRPASWFVKAIIASLLPFGTIFMDNKLWKQEEELTNQR